MKTTFKIILAISLIILVLILSFFIYFFISTKNVVLDPNKLVNTNRTISYYDNENNFLFKESENDSKLITKITDIPLHVQNAFISIEDKRFYNHKGVDFKGLTRAFFNNIASFSFKEGGSTITQQLIKNTHLSNQKTIQRKLSEIKLSFLLEKKYNKEQILEMYLNTIYFGDNCYGITKASKHYFNKTPNQLSINEAAALAGIIKSPLNYSPITNSENCFDRKNIVLKQMYKQGYITKSQFDTNYKAPVFTNPANNENVGYDYFSLVRKEYLEKIKHNPYLSNNVNVYTNFCKDKQNILKNTLLSTKTNTDKSSIIIEKDGCISAYYSTCGNISRQMGSTLKPLLVYSPAIERNVVFSCSPILDEKINFNGYSPSNFNNKYYGYVSVKESLAKSLNSCAIKLLNYTGIEESKKYLNLTDINLTENDNNLSLALGCSEKGATLSELTSAYGVFINNGYYYKPFTIREITIDDGECIYKHRKREEKIFSEETISIVNDMLDYTVSNGTAKNLKECNIPLCAKTGTVGVNSGNTDAYCISYNSKQILGVWFGNKDYSLMQNSLTGGTIPTTLSNNIWSEIYSNEAPPESYIKSSNVLEKYIDKIDYVENNKITLANEITPNRYKFKSIFKQNNIPNTTSERFILPQIKNAEIFVENDKISISFCLAEYYNAKIFRKDKYSKKLLVDLQECKTNYLYIDDDILTNTEYQYSIIPYYKCDGKVYYGNEYLLKKIKTPAVYLDDWWINNHC